MEYLIPQDNELYIDYIQRIKKVRENKDIGPFCEIHHILPKCLGGTNDPCNLIQLYYQEHYYAHKLLALQYPEERGLLLAWWNLANVPGSSTRKNLREVTITADEYALLRTQVRMASLGDKNPNYGNTGSKNPLSIPLRCIETNILYENAHDVQTKTGITQALTAARGKRLTAGGYH